MPRGALAERLASLRLPPDAGTEREVRRLVDEFVDDCKTSGWPPERVIVAVKQIARAAGLNPSTMHATREPGMTPTDDFLVAMVGWCIDRYYRQ